MGCNSSKNGKQFRNCDLIQQLNEDERNIIQIMVEIENERRNQATLRQERQMKYLEKQFNTMSSKLGIKNSQSFINVMNESTFFPFYKMSDDGLQHIDGQQCYNGTNELEEKEIPLETLVSNHRLVRKQQQII